MSKNVHAVAVVCEGRTIDAQLDYEIETSMINPCSTFRLTFAWDRAIWRALPRDANLKILIDQTVMLDGYVDKRTKNTGREGTTMTIAGRDRAGRVFQESTPKISYDGLALSEVVRRLVQPWYASVTFDASRDRSVRRGKGFKVPTGNEPLVVRKIVTRGAVHPGQTRRQIIEELCSQDGLVAYGSADGREYFVGLPNYSQVPQYLITHCAEGSDRPTSHTGAIEMTYDEDNGDRYSVVAVVGAGGGTDNDLGESVSSRRAAVYDYPLNRTDGTGRDFRYPKRLIMPERSFNSIEEALKVAAREAARRDFHRTTLSVTMPYHGQRYATGPSTLFAIHTMANVTDEELEFDEDMMIYAVTYRGSRKDGQTSRLSLVPKDTVITL